MEKKRNLLLIVLSYAAIYLIWGSTYLFIALAVESVPPSWIISFRFLVAGVLFVAVPLITRQVKKLPTKEELGTSLFLAFFLLIMGNGVVTVAEKTVDSYLVALLISTTPLLVNVLNRFIFKTPLKPAQLIGFFLGFLGVAFLLYQEGPSQESNWRGIALVFLAISCWAFGTSFSKKLKHHSNPFFSTGIQMLMAGVIGLAVVLFQGEAPTDIWQASTPLSRLSVLYLSLVGGLAIAAYNYLLKVEPTSRVTSYALINPAIATVLGIWVREESPSQFLWIGLSLILVGLFFMLYLGTHSSKKNQQERSKQEKVS